MKYNRAFTCSLISIFLWFLLIPSASLGKQKIQDEPPPRTNGRSAGSRGCSSNSRILQNAPPALILLSPNKKRATTISSNPIFAWFVRDTQTRKMQFRLYQKDRATKEYELVKEIKDKDFESKAGIMVLPLPKTVKLARGKKYLWQVELVCDRNRPSANLFAEAEIEIATMQPTLKNKLNQTANPDDKAMLFAKHGLEYDALMSVLAENKTSVAMKRRMNKLKVALLNQITSEPSELKTLQSSRIHWMKME
ncbi:MAG: DUF928 domain-containing protein [Rivularia sp. (in: Bacteria)]|nr:DUF928 domain-containing protein [Rivularia sp. MS3]